MRLKGDEQLVLLALHGGNLQGCAVESDRMQSILRKFSGLNWIDDNKAITRRGAHVAAKQIDVTTASANLDQTPITNTESESSDDGDVHGQEEPRVEGRARRPTRRGDPAKARDRTNEPGDRPTPDAEE